MDRAYGSVMQMTLFSSAYPLLLYREEVDSPTKADQDADEFYTKMIIDQKSYPICTAVVALTMLRYTEWKRGLTPGVYSYAHQYFYGKDLVQRDDGHEIEPQLLGGLPLAAVLQSIRDYGVKRGSNSESDLDPKLAASEVGHTDVKRWAIAHNSLAIDVKINRLYPTLSNLVNAIKGGDKVGLCIRIDRHADEWFKSPGQQRQSKYVLPEPRFYHPRVATHAVLIVNVDEETKLFMVQNSFGSENGHGGFFFMSSESVLNGNMTGLEFFTLS